MRMKENWENAFPKISQVFHNRIEHTLESLEEKEDRHYRGGIKWKKPIVLAASLGALLGLSLTVYAAVHLFAVYGQKDEDTGMYTYYFEVEEEFEAKPIRILPGYLPEGFASIGNEEEFVYKKEQDPSQSIIINSSNWSDKLSVPYVSWQEEVRLNGVRAEILTRNGLEYNHVILLFFEEDGQVIEIMATEGIPLEEVKKVAENLSYEIVPEGDAYQAFNSRDEEKGTEAWVEPTITEEYMVEVGEEMQDLGVEESEYVQPVTYKVQNILITDEMPDLDDEGFGTFKDILLENVKDNGTLKPRERVMRYWEDNKMKSKSEIIGMKFILLTMTFANNTNENMTDISASPQIRYLKANEDKTFTFVEKDYEWSELLGEGRAIYFDQSDYSEPSHYFYMDLKAGEKKEVHLLYAVDEDRIGEGYFTFNLSGFGSKNKCMDQYVKIQE